MELSFWAASDVGRKRKHNEDDFLIDKKLSLFAVADGMGGHASGEIASQLAVSSFRAAIEERRPMLDAYLRHDEKVKAQHILAALETTVQAAGLTIYERGQKEREKRGMGTTLSALLLLGERAFIAHVGDSRVYLIRQNQVVQLTEDHSLVNELIRHGKVTRESLASSPYASYKNAVTRALGVYETTQVDTVDLEVLPGDQFLICSDGLHAYLRDKDILSFLSDDHVTAIPQKLVDHANQGGGHDNITAVIMRVQEDTTGAGQARTQELNRKVEVLRQMPLFRHLTYKEILRVLSVTQVADFAVGDEILREGEPGDDLFIVLKGKVRLHKDGAFVTHLGPGAHFGEMALVDKGPRSVSASAEDRTRALVLKRQDFNEIIRNDPRLSVKLLWSFVQVLAQRLRKTTADLTGARQDVPDVTDETMFDD